MPVLVVQYKWPDQFDPNKFELTVELINGLRTLVQNPVVESPIWEIQKLLGEMELVNIEQVQEHEQFNNIL